MNVIRKILIANRGEIAVRIIRTCKELNILTVAVYSDIDKNAPYVQMADESYYIGAPPAMESYLNQSKIIAIARQTKADAIHPGYGFLSENSTFAQNVINAGIVFIGPTPEAMKLMGDKTSARELAQSIGVPIVPGTPGPINSIKQAEDIAVKIGFPVLLKAAGGGGGKGMRIVEDTSELSSAFDAAKSEARSAFGDDRVYIEKYIVSPRHIEVQVLADQHGNVVHLGERECSIQRRHQKIMEESPSVVVDETLRKALTSAAVRLVKASKYVNAGTIEFILDAEKNFYFLEMNTRLQVEHPVTEMRTGIDIVKEQIRIAEGKMLPFSQEEITFSGHAIECRVYAEDTLNNFFPSTGTISFIGSTGGFGIREDRGVETGTVISTYYDPMISKVISWGKSRNESIERMVSTLKDYDLFGVKNNIDICLWVLTHPNFIAGNFSTSFIKEHFELIEVSTIPHYISEIAAIVSSAYHQQSTLQFVHQQRNGARLWKSKSTEFYH